MKRKPFLLYAVMIVCLLAGCASADQPAAGSAETPEIAKVEVYRASDHMLLKTIEDEQALAEFSRHIVFDEDYEWATDPAESAETFLFAVYKKPGTLASDGIPELVFTITTYESLDAMTLTIKGEKADVLPLPEGVLTFTQEIPPETALYFKELAEE